MKMRGFTLIELITTMILVGIMAAVAVPRMSLLSGWNEIGFRDQLKSTLEFARKAAVAQRRAVTVNFDAGWVRVVYQRQTPEGIGAAATADLILPGQATNAIGIPTGVTLTGAPATLSFNASGVPSAGASMTVSSGGTITVEAVTGYVH